jgi:hypothetical protein
MDRRRLDETDRSGKETPSMPQNTYRQGVLGDERGRRSSAGVIVDGGVTPMGKAGAVVVAEDMGSFEVAGAN